jgi:O-antigen/teichoic acid export membrane protein
MSAGLPLLILSFLSTIILVVWSRNGSGHRNFRVIATATIILSLVASWAALLTFGVFHPVGSWGIALGFIISIGAFFVPIVHNRFGRNDNT